MFSKPSIIFNLILCAILAGCATVSDKTTEPTPEAAAQTTPRSEAIRPFPKGVLYELLAGELAGIRNQPEIALERYMVQAEATRDIAVTERAANIAAYLGATPELVQLTELWLQLEPANHRARYLAALALAEAGRPIEAFDHSESLLLNGDHTALVTLAEYSGRMPPELRQQLLERFNGLEEKYADNPHVAIGLALIMQSLQQYDDALHAAKRAKKQLGDSENLTLLIARLQQQKGDREAALATLQHALSAQPQSRALRLHYARLLAEDDLTATYQQLKILLEQNPADIELKYTLAVTSRQLGKNEEASGLFRALLGNPLLSASSHFQLGEMAEQAGDIEAAMLHYRQVRQGPKLVEAAARLCKLMSETQQADKARLYLQQLRLEQPQSAVLLYQVESEMLLEQDKMHTAHSLLTEALERHPNNLSLLYTRSMVSEQNDDFTSSEKDLRTIIALDEDNAMALNALGYTMTLHTTRYREAHDLIKKALLLEPEDPAIIDSLGWVLYRMGRHEEALAYLRQAAAQLPDAEIIAHLGEVLWVTGKTTEAKSVWQSILDHDPDNSIIHDTIQRLRAGKE